MKKIVCFHVLNDFSGSPKVLDMVVSGLLSKGYTIDLVTSKGPGALSHFKNIEGVKNYSYHYVFTGNMLWNTIQFVFVQLSIFFLSFRYAFSKDVVFYLNTIMPLGAALAGKLLRKRIVYHYHENASAKSKFYVVLAWFMQKLADDIICVSDYQRSFLQRRQGVETIPNSVSPEFERKCLSIRSSIRKDKRVLMLSSLKIYKGTLEFFQLASLLPEYKFDLVINDSWEQIHRFMSEHQLSPLPNLQLWDRQSQVLPFYEQASLVLNLTNKEMAIETFGLTVLEALTAGLPVIVPTVGGVADLVIDGYNGFKIDVKNLDCIKTKIVDIFENQELYNDLCRQAASSSEPYSYSKMISGIEGIVCFGD